MKINFLKNLFCIKCKGFVNVEKILEGVILFYLFFFFFYKTIVKKVIIYFLYFLQSNKS